MPFHWPELAVVLVIALLFFGPKRLPEMGSAIGKTIKEFRHTMSEVTEPKEKDTTNQLTTTSTAKIEPPAETVA